MFRPRGHLQEDCSPLHLILKMSGTQTSDQLSAHEHNDGTSTMKSGSESVERMGQTKTHATYIEREEVAMLSAEHRSYLLRRHGTLELDPVPGHGDADPYNWPTWKVVYLLSQAPRTPLLIHCIRGNRKSRTLSLSPYTPVWPPLQPHPFNRHSSQLLRISA